MENLFIRLTQRTPSGQNPIYINVNQIIAIRKLSLDAYVRVFLTHITEPIIVQESTKQIMDIITQKTKLFNHLKNNNK